MALSTQPYKGARDFYPEDKRLQKYLFKTIRKTVEKYGYVEYDAPLLEPLELYAAKTGDEIVNDQTYSFTDRGERQVVIRPEMTPSVSRMVAGRRQELAYPVRWYSIVENWRYERPQKGRLRQFYQLNVDVFGIDNIAAEHETIMIADAVLRSFGAKRAMYSIRLNSRKLMDAFFSDYLHLDSVQAQTMGKLIDRMHKIERGEFIAEAEALLTPSQREEGLAHHLFDTLAIKDINELPEVLHAHPAVAQLKQLFKLLDASGVSNATFDMSIMRGFDYYTDIVFEIYDTDPENSRSMFGGGRYDGLVGLFGVEPVPTVGFAMGDVILANFLETHNLLPKLQTETDVYVVLIGDIYDKAQKPVAEMREMGLNVALDTSGKKAGDQIKNAVKQGAHYALFIGEQELEDEQFTLKNLDTGTEEKHGLQRIVSVVKDYRKQ